jgi:hypothetical protein
MCVNIHSNITHINRNAKRIIIYQYSSRPARVKGLGFSN